MDDESRTESEELTSHAPTQEQPIEKRVATLELQMAEILRSHSGLTVAGEKDWLNTVGTRQDDAFSREADELGEAWRKNVKD